MSGPSTIGDGDRPGSPSRYYADYVFRGLAAPDVRALFAHPLLAPDPGPVAAEHLESCAGWLSFLLGPGWHRAGPALLGGASPPPGSATVGALDLWDFNVEFRDLTPGVERVVLDAAARVLGRNPFLDLHVSLGLKPVQGYGSASLSLGPRGGGGVASSLWVMGETDPDVPRAPLVRAFVEAVGLADQLAVEAGDRSVAVHSVGPPDDPGDVDLRLGTAETSGESRPVSDPCVTRRPWFSVKHGRPTRRTGWPSVHARAGLCLIVYEAAALAQRLFVEPGAGWVRDRISLGGAPGLLVDVAGRLAARGVESWVQVSYGGAYDVDAALEIAAYAHRLRAVVRAVTPPGGPPVALELRRSRSEEPEASPSEDPAQFTVIAKYDGPPAAWEDPDGPLGRWLNAVRALYPDHAAFGPADD